MGWSRFACLAAVLLIPLSSTTFATFILEIQTTDLLEPGQIATVQVSGRNDTGTILLSGFDLKFDILPPAGIGRPVGITNAAPFIANPVFTAPGTVTQIATASADIFVNGDYGGGSFLSIGAAPTTLFTMRFNLEAGLAEGTYAINLVDTRPAGAFGVYDSTASRVEPLQFIQGAIRVRAVPEPSSALLILCGTLAVGVFARSRRNRSPNA